MYAAYVYLLPAIMAAHRSRRAVPREVIDEELLPMGHLSGPPRLARRPAALEMPSRRAAEPPTLRAARTAR